MDELDSFHDIEMTILEEDSDVDVVGLDSDAECIDIGSNIGVDLDSSNHHKVKKITVRGFVNLCQLLPKILCAVLSMCNKCVRSVNICLVFCIRFSFVCVCPSNMSNCCRQKD